MSGNLPDTAAKRNEYPLADGLLYYFPAALAAVARVSKIGNDQHNPGEPMHWARGKSTDHANKILRHQLDAGTLDSDGTRHSAKVAWRALAQLQEELEREEGAPLPRNARLPNHAATMREAKIAHDMAWAKGIGNADAAHIERIPKWSPGWINTPPNCDGLSARDVRAPHPMAAEEIRDHDERLGGGESHP